MIYYIVLAISFVFMLVGIIGIVKSDLNDELVAFSILFSIGLLTGCITICYNVIISNTPEEQYKTKVEAVDRANKELQKFFIDHPEFKEPEKK